jgi:hypothetical protein
MNWLVFSYSLPAKSGRRVAIWRRLRLVGTISPVSSVYLLPDRPHCLEALRWLSQEIRQAQGEALVMCVAKFETLTDEAVIELFRASRREEYREIATQAALLETAAAAAQPQERERLKEQLGKLRRRYTDVQRIDYFGAPEATSLTVRLAQLEQALMPFAPRQSSTATVQIAEYRGRHWVTRPHPHVDRLACIWLIRRFIDASAAIRYSVESESGEIAFDMERGQFTHQGRMCTFETMLDAFGLDDPALRLIADIVHEIDLRDSMFMRPETAGIDAILNGWERAGIADADLEAHGTALFSGLYAARELHISQEGESQ